MFDIRLRGQDLSYIRMFRVALSEETDQARLEAIQNVRQEVDAQSIKIFRDDELFWPAIKRHPRTIEWIAETSPDRHDAGSAIAELLERYEKRNERHLDIAERIGNAVFSTIKDKEFRGLQTKSGILKMVSDEARDLKLHGGRDKDVVRKIWTTYRGVVHLGMALDYLYDNPDQDFQLLQKAEFYREQLATNRPRNATEPYVSPEVQFQFL